MSPSRFSARATITMSPVSWASARARMEFPDPRQAVAHHRDGVIWLPAPQRQDAADKHRPRHEPRARVLQGRRRLIEQLFRPLNVASRHRDRRHPDLCVANAPRDAQRLEPLNGADESFARPVQIAERVFDACRQIVSAYDHIHGIFSRSITNPG